MNESSATTFSGDITGLNGKLVKEGAAELTLSGNNNYTGTTTINTGTLRLAAQNITGTSIAIDGGWTAA